MYNPYRGQCLIPLLRLVHPRGVQCNVLVDILYIRLFWNVDLPVKGNPYIYSHMLTRGVSPDKMLSDQGHGSLIYSLNRPGIEEIVKGWVQDACSAR